MTEEVVDMLRRLVEERDEARAAIARVRALCDNAEADPSRGVTFGGEPFPARLRVEDVLAALDGAS